MQIELSEYTSGWIELFEQEFTLISNNFPINEFVIEHIGSTAVPGLVAKPIIDILIGIRTLPTDMQNIVDHLGNLNYKYVKEYNLIIPERRYFHKILNGKHTHHIHLVELGSDFWKRHIHFRDQLRSNLKLKQAYQELKVMLSKQEWDSSNDYALAKSNFIRSAEAAGKD